MNNTPTSGKQVFDLEYWFRLPALEELTVPFSSLGKWSRLFECVQDQCLRVLVTDWDCDGIEHHRYDELSLAVSTLQVLASGSIVIAVVTEADQANAQRFVPAEAQSHICSSIDAVDTVNTKNTQGATQVRMNDQTNPVELGRDREPKVVSVVSGVPGR